MPPHEAEKAFVARGAVREVGFQNALDGLRHRFRGHIAIKVAADRGDDPQWLYTVVFDGRELWGPDGDPTLKISIEAFEPYLDPA